MPLLAKLILAAFGLCLIAVALILRLRDQSRLHAAANWPTSAGQILAATIATDETGEHIVHQAVLRYSYRASDVARAGHRVRLLKDGRTTNRGKAEAVVSRYPVGTDLAVHYDPANPDRACLEVETPPQAHLWLGVLGLALIVAALFMPS